MLRFERSRRVDPLEFGTKKSKNSHSREFLGTNVHTCAITSVVYWFRAKISDSIDLPFCPLYIPCCCCVYFRCRVNKWPPYTFAQPPSRSLVLVAKRVCKRNAEWHCERSAPFDVTDVRHVTDRRPIYTDPLPLELLHITIVYVLPRLPYCLAPASVCVFYSLLDAGMFDA